MGVDDSGVDLGQ